MVILGLLCHGLTQGTRDVSIKDPGGKERYIGGTEITEVMMVLSGGIHVRA